ncbi:hypothetical protein GBA52_013211 [Prunus armeniaca]|nr:hypothetical protein GBA52_013211 [Prunus armeniaca]
MRLYCACCWLDYKMCFMQVEILGNVQFTGETLPKFWQKVSCPKSSLVKEDIVLRSKPGVAVMPGSPQGSSRVPGNSGRVLSAAVFFFDCCRLYRLFLFIYIIIIIIISMFDKMMLWPIFIDVESDKENVREKDPMLVNCVENIDEDLLGRVVSTEEEAYNFYNNYATRVGFNVRRGQNFFCSNLVIFVQKKVFD